MQTFAIKHRAQLTWEDLPFVEAPVFAHTHIMQMLNNPNHLWMRIENLPEFIRTEIGSYRSLRNHDYANTQIERLIGSGLYFNVCRTGKPFCAAFTWQEDPEHPHKGFWTDPLNYYWRASVAIKNQLMLIANQWHRLQMQEDSSSSFVITMENFDPRTLKWTANASSSKGMMLSTDMDPNFQMSGGTVEEWNQLNEEADLMRVIGKENRQMEIDALRSDPKAIQEFLISKGHVEVGAADGIIGKRTQLGIHNYINGTVAAKEITTPLPKSVKVENKQNRSGSPFENDYDQIIWDASEKYGVPPEILKAKIRKESTFNNAAVNKNNVDGSTTVGLGQFTEDTARSRGLRVDSIIDERMDPAKSIPMQAEYLKSQYEKFRQSALSDTEGWRFALAAYNLGPELVIKQLTNARPYMKENKIPYNHPSMSFRNGTYTPKIMGLSGDIDGWAKEYSNDFLRFKK